MKKARYLYIIIVSLFLYLPIVNAACGDLVYDVLDLKITSETVIIDGWALIHMTEINANANKKEEIKIGLCNESETKCLYGDSDGFGSGFDFSKAMEYGSGNPYTCTTDNSTSNCHYKGIGFESKFPLNKIYEVFSTDGENQNLHFIIKVTNDDYNNKYKNGNCSGTKIFNDMIGSTVVKEEGKYWVKENLKILKSVITGNSTNNNNIEVRAEGSDELLFTGWHVIASNSNDIIHFGWGQIYKYNGSENVVKFSDRATAKSPGKYIIKASKTPKKFFSTIDVGWRYYTCDMNNNFNITEFISSGSKNGGFCETINNFNCIDTLRQTISGQCNDEKREYYATMSFAKVYGLTNLKIKIKDEKKCPIDNENSKKLSCNNTTSVTGECSELTVSNGNEMTTVNIKQTGTIANLLSPKEIYNGGGIKFGILYYNKIQFDYVSGSKNISITDIMNSRIKGTEDIKLENIKIGNINVSDTYIKKTCEQIKNDNSVETICLFHFTPQLVNEDGSIVKDDIDASYDLGINNKYYLPLEYRSVYRVSGDLVNASFLDKNAAIGDSKNNKPWYGTKWEKISLSDDGTCDINVYKLGPGSDEIIDNKIIYKFIYRPIDLKNPFPRNRIIGLNWNLWYTNDSNRYRLEHSYDNLEYDIELNNIIINKIKKYNSSNDYFNFDYDNFIKDIGLKVGGN